MTDVENTKIDYKKLFAMMAVCYARDLLAIPAMTREQCIDMPIDNLIKCIENVPEDDITELSMKICDIFLDRYRKDPEEQAEQSGAGHGN